MSVYVTTFETTSLGTNRNSYLSSSDAQLFIRPNNLSESFFGSSDNDLFHVASYDLNGNLMTYVEESPSKQYSKINYIYSDVDGNSFNYFYNKSISNILFDDNLNTLFDVSGFINEKNPSSSFQLLINPVTNTFTKNNSLIVTEIGSSKKELKLAPVFNYTNVDKNVSCILSGSSILLDGSSSIDIKNGILYTIFAKDGIDDLFISKQQNGLTYSDGVLFKKSKNQIVLDLTKITISDDLWLCDKTGKNSAVKLVLSGTIDRSDFDASVQFNTLDNSSFIVKQIYDGMIDGLNSFDISELYSPMSMNYPSYVNDIKTTFGFSSEGQIIEFISSMYYGSHTYDNQLNQDKYLEGIYSYVVNHLNFNYEFNDNFDNLNNEINHIIKQTIDNFVEFKTRGNRQTQQEINSVYFFTTIFTNLFSSILYNIKTSYVTKFNRPLCNALNFGNGSIYPILNSRIDTTNGSPIYVVKLETELDTSITEKTSCVNIINISVEPTLQTITYVLQPSSINTIKLSSPNFSVGSNGYPTLAQKKTPFFNEQLLSLTSMTSSLIDTTIKNQTFNIDFSDFKNFVVFSSANMRVKIFENKIKTISQLNSKLTSVISSSVYSTKQTDIDSLSSQIEDTVKSFDFYESYLYNTKMFTYDSVTDSFVEFNGIKNRPSSYVADLEASARTYDRENVDSLVNNTPEYIRNDDRYDDYLKFLCMIGHYFDNIYLYVSNFAFYNKVGENFSDGIQTNILKYILNSFGIDVPPTISSGTDDSTIEEYHLSSDEIPSLQNSVSLDNKTKTIWKRLLNNLPFLYKSKGTVECIRYIFSIYGVPENLITVKEFGGGYYSPDIMSTNIKNENIYPPEFIGTPGESIVLNSIDNHNSINFKLYINASQYEKQSRLIIPIYNRYINYFGGQQQFFSFGVIKETENIGRIYFTTRDNSINDINSDPSSFNFISEPTVLFDNNIYNVLIRRGSSVNEVFDSSLVKYDVLLSNMTNISEGESVKEFSFYLQTSASAFYNTSSNDSWGNSTYLPVTSSIVETASYKFSQSLDILSTLRGTKLKINDENGSFSGIGNISDVVDNFFTTASFRGCIDRITYQSSSLQTDTFLSNSYNYNYYCDGNPSASFENILYRFYFYPPVDISVSSSIGNGFPVSNFNSACSGTIAYMQNFKGDNYVEVFNTSSCLSESTVSFPYQCKEFYVSNTYFTKEVGPDRDENVKIGHVTLLNPSNVVSPKNKVTVKSSENSFVDSNRLGMFVSPISERNDDILNFFGTEDIISTIADPSSIYSDKYSELKTLRNEFYSIPKNKILFNELFALYKMYIDKSIFDTLRYFLPARNKIYTGILIEPTILERPKIESKPVTVENVSIDDATIVPIKDVSADMVTPSTSSAAFNFMFNDVYSYNNFNRVQSINDIPDDYQLTIFINPSGDTEYKGGYYNVYEKTYCRSIFNQMGDDIVGETKKYFKELVLVTGSVSDITFGNSYKQITTVNYYNNLNFKPLSFRKETYLTSGSVNFPTNFIKSRQTNNTTINNSNLTINSVSPVISTSVGNVLKQGINL